MMDTKEALKELEDLTVDYGNRNEEQIARLDEAIDMAMDALRNLPNRLRQATDTISRQDARMCLTGDVTNMSIEQYIKMVDKRLEQLQPSPSKPSEQHISSLETPCDHCYFFTHKCTYPGKCADRAILEAAHEGGAV